VWGDTAAPCCLVELTCQVERGSVPQSQGINFSTKANQKEKGEEKAGVVVQVTEFPFRIGSVAQRQTKQGRTITPASGEDLSRLPRQSALLMGLYGSLPTGFYTDTKKKYIPFKLGIRERLGSFPLRNRLP